VKTSDTSPFILFAVPSPGCRETGSANKVIHNPWKQGTGSPPAGMHPFLTGDRPKACPVESRLGESSRKPLGGLVDTAARRLVDTTRKNR